MLTAFPNMEQVAVDSYIIPKIWTERVLKRPKTTLFLGRLGLKMPSSKHILSHLVVSLT